MPQVFCAICGRGFATLESLRQHIRQKHKKCATKQKNQAKEHL